MESGTLNLKNELKTNHLCRLEASRSNWKKERKRKSDENTERRIQEDIKNFVNVMSKLYNNKKRKNPSVSNEISTSRFNDRDKDWVQGQKMQPRITGEKRKPKKKYPLQPKNLKNNQ